MYLYFLLDKSKALNTFKVFKIEVEKQKEIKIKIVKSDRVGEYYERYTKKQKLKVRFIEFLQGEAIILPNTPCLENHNKMVCLKEGIVL